MSVVSWCIYIYIYVYMYTVVKTCLIEFQQEDEWAPDSSFKLWFLLCPSTVVQGFATSSPNITRSPSWVRFMKNLGFVHVGGERWAENTHTAGRRGTAPRNGSRNYYECDSIHSYL